METYKAILVEVLQYFMFLVRITVDNTTLNVHKRGHVLYH